MDMERVIVLDFGAQYSQLIARRVRECGVYCEIMPYNTPAAELEALQPKGIILSGGPSSVYAKDAPVLEPELFDLGIPVLGICYGLQLMMHMLGGEVQPASKREYGRAAVEILDYEDLFKGFESDGPLTVWMSHSDHVVAAGGFTVLAATSHAPITAVADRQRRLYGVQFHPEVVHTQRGAELLRNFLIEVCRCAADWSMQSFAEEAVREIRSQIGSGQVVCGLSGGIDSSVAAALVHRAVGDQLTCIYVDHGFMRKGESEQVVDTFGRQFKMNLLHVDARQQFLDKLFGVTDPEQKRKIIGNQFIRVFEAEASKLGDVDFLVQGTLYPDVIESGTAQASVIKSHHNVGGLPEDIKFSLVEPLRALFKDEVRKLAQELGLPDEITYRHPFPGPGLAIRVIGEVSRERLDILREVDAIAVEEIWRAGEYRNIWQAFAVLTDTRTVGVMGDERTYDYVAAIRAVTSEDGMTADWARVPYELLEAISRRVMNEVKGINRVVYDISSKPPATIEWE